MKDEIFGDKVILRPLREEDAAFFAQWCSNPRIMFECGLHEAATLEKELERIRKPEEGDRDWYAVTDMSGRLVGEVGLLRIWPHWHCTDMSIIIPNPADRGKGYGGDAVRLILARAFFHYNMNRVAIGVVGANTQAIAFYEKIGFKKEGIQEQGYFYNNSFSDFVMMRMLKSEYRYT